MIARWGLLLFMGMMAVVAQIGLVATFPQPFSSINIILVILIFSFFLNSKKGILFFLILWIGFLIELFSPSAFGLQLLSLLATFFLVTTVSHILLTNKTFTVLLVTSILIFIFYNLIFVFLNFLVDIKYDLNISYSISDYFSAGVIGSLINLPIIIFFNFVIKKSAKFFKGIFIIN